MSNMPAALVARRLRNLCMTFFCGDYTSKYKYVEKRLSEWEETSKSLISQYEFHLKAFVDIASYLPLTKEALEQLVFITEPPLIFAFNCVFHNSVKLLEEQGEDISYSVPKNDYDFMKKFLFISEPSFVQ